MLSEGDVLAQFSILAYVSFRCNATDPANRDCLENKKTKPHVLYLINMGKIYL